MKIPVVSDDPEVQWHYESMRLKGESHNISLMAATRIAPGTMGTDRAFMEGRMLNHGLDPCPWNQQYIMSTAKRAGVVTTGKVYCSQLADKRGPADPRAWVSGVDDVRAVCRDRGWGCSGSVRIQGAEPPPVEVEALAPDLVQEIMQKRLAENPDLKNKLDDLREEVIETHGTPVDETRFVDAAKARAKKKSTKKIISV